MKSVFIGFVLALALFLTGCANVSEPSISVIPFLYDFGDIAQSDGPVSTTFTVRNTGKELIQLYRLSTSCGCTIAEMDMSDMRPAESREMKVTFDPMVHPDQLGAIERVVYLQTSDPEIPEIEIDITGNVVK